MSDAQRLSYPECLATAPAGVCVYCGAHVRNISTSTDPAHAWWVNAAGPPSAWCDSNNPMASYRHAPLPDCAVP